MNPRDYTKLQPFMPYLKSVHTMPISHTSKLVYTLLLDASLERGQSDEKGNSFVCYPLSDLAHMLGRSTMTVKRALAELDDWALIVRRSPGVGHPNRIYVSIPKVAKVYGAVTAP